MAWTDGTAEVYSRVKELEEENRDLKDQFCYLDIECERLEKENSALEAEIERLNILIKKADEHFSEGDFAKGISIIINLVKEM